MRYIYLLMFIGCLTFAAGSYGLFDLYDKYDKMEHTEGTVTYLKTERLIDIGKYTTSTRQ